MNDEYIIYNTTTGTIESATDSVLINVGELPPVVDDWEEYLKTGNYTAIPVELCRFDVFQLDVVIEDMIAEGDKRPELQVLNALSVKELNDRVLILLSENPSLYKGIDTTRRSIINGLVQLVRDLTPPQANQE